MKVASVFYFAVGLVDHLRFRSYRYDLGRCFDHLVTTLEKEASFDENERVYRTFHRRLLEQKDYYERDRSFHANAPWHNLVSCFTNTVEWLDFDNSFEVDQLQGMAIYEAIGKLRQAWNNVPLSMKDRMSNVGIMFEGYDGIHPYHLITGLAGATTAQSIRSHIVTVALHDKSSKDVPAFQNLRQQP